MAFEEAIQAFVKSYSNKFVSGTKICAREDVYCCLRMALSETSNKCVYIYTFPLDQRVCNLRPTSVLQNMPQNSTDIFQNGLLILPISLQIMSFKKTDEELVMGQIVTIKLNNKTRF